MKHSIPSWHLIVFGGFGTEYSMTALLTLPFVTKSAAVFKNERLLTIFIGQVKQQDATQATPTGSGGHQWVWLDHQTAQREKINCES